MYVYKLTLTKEIIYCVKHLPSFLADRKNAGLLLTTDAFKESLAKVQGKPTPVAEPVAETVAEEVAPEPETTPTPTPKKKPIKKAATKNASDS